MEYINIFKDTLLNKYADFKGNAGRTEYWTFVVVYIILAAICGAISQILSSILGLVLFIPNLAVTVRRLHDRGKSGWWVLIALVPVIGTIYLIYLLATKK